MRKKLSRRERSAIYEKIKTVLIAVLCLCCIFLIYSIISLQIMPKNIIGSVPSDVSMPADASRENALKIFTKLAEPETVIINSQVSRKEIRVGDADFDTVIGTVSRAMQSIYAKDAVIFQVENKKEWETAIKSNSVYIRYPSTRPTEFDAGFLGAKNTAVTSGLVEYSEALLVPDHTDGGKITVMFPESTGGIIKIKTSTVSTALNDILNTEPRGGTHCSFAYELYPDSKGPTSLSPMLIIPDSEISMYPLNVNVPWIYSHGISPTKMTDFTQRLLNIFGYNPNTIRQYSDTNGALVFVSEFGTLRAYKDGTIEYKSLDNSDGIALATDNQSGSLYKTVSEITEITEGIFSLCGIASSGEDHALKITDITKNENGKGFRLSMDYYIKGSRLRLPGKNAIEATVIGSTLTELKMCVKTFSIGEETVALPHFLTALDEFCTNNPNDKNVDFAAPVYEYKEDGTEIICNWKIEGSI